MTPKSWVLMTALPPTRGHENLIRYASTLSSACHVVICTQPGEPFAFQRWLWAYQLRLAKIHEVRDEIQQEPVDENDTAFWADWKQRLMGLGFRQGDYIVASEIYGARLAEEVGGIFMPYDPYRSITFTKATFVRDDPLDYFEWVAPSFQSNLRTRVTIFGAESTGKTTLTNNLDYLQEWQGLCDKIITLPEWARPYLEMVGPEVDVEKMLAIWKGQRALQDHAHSIAENKAVIVQDTDLFSTVGFWRYWSPNTVPPHLDADAVGRKSDLYLITPSAIPFEPDQLRYAGTERETTDQYWIDLCEEFGLNYKVLEPGAKNWVAMNAADLIEKHWKQTIGGRLSYHRRGKEYT